MTLRYCHPAINVKPVVTDVDNKLEEKPIRRLAVLFAWMLAKDKHLEKYRNLYFRRGFDVLTVTTSPLELLLPERGSQPIAKNVLNFMNDQISNYPEIVVHAFSVGGYQFGEVLVEMAKDKNKQILNNMRKAIKGLICDSSADMEAIPNGLSRAVTDNWFLQKALKNYIAFHMKLFDSIATKHYMASSQAFKNNVVRCPALILVSHDDAVGNPEANQRVRESWLKLGLHVQWKCFDSSSHVGHLHRYPEEYQREVDLFLKKVIK